MDALRRDDIDSARELSPKDKLSQALEVMAYGLAAKRQNLQRRTSGASADEIDKDKVDKDKVDKDFDAWLFDGH